MLPCVLFTPETRFLELRKLFAKFDQKARAKAKPVQSDSSSEDEASRPPAKRTKQKTAAPRTQKPILPLTRGKLKGRKIMLPHSVWPEEECEEYDGAGWFAEITSESYGVAGVRIGENIYHFKVDLVVQWVPHSSELSRLTS